MSIVNIENKKKRAAYPDSGFKAISTCPIPANFPDSHFFLQYLPATGIGGTYWWFVFHKNMINRNSFLWKQLFLVVVGKERNPLG